MEKLTIKEILKNKERNMTWLSGQLGVCLETVSRYNKNPHKLTVEKLTAIAAVLEVQPEEINTCPPCQIKK